MTDRYNIVRYFYKSARRRVVARRLTLNEAQAHCRDPDSSSRTTTSYVGLARTRKRGPWFDGFTQV